MPTIENRITIHGSLFDIFRTVTDFETMQQWQPNLLDVSITAGNPIRSGTMLSMRRKFMGRDIFINVDVIEFQRNKQVELKGMFGTFPYRRVIEFASSGRDVMIRDVITVRTSFLYFWYAPFLSSALNGQIKQEWQNAKLMIESS